MLEMKNNLYKTQFDNTDKDTTEVNRMKVLQDLLDSKQNEIKSLQKSLNLRTKEVSMLRKFQGGSGRKANGTMKALDLGGLVWVIWV